MSNRKERKEEEARAAQERYAQAEAQAQAERAAEQERNSPRGRAQAAIKNGHPYFGIVLDAAHGHGWIGHIEQVGWRLHSVSGYHGVSWEASSPYGAVRAPAQPKSDDHYVYYLFHRTE